MSQCTIEPYLFYGGRCDEAIAFYQHAIGAEVEMVMRFNESPDPPPPGMVPDGFEEKVMHASLRIGGARVMLSDGCDPELGFAGFSLAVSVEDEAEADRVFNGLAAGGNVTMPLCKTFWSPRYGMLTDKFGIHWMVMVPGEQDSAS